MARGAGEQNSRSASPVRLISPSFARWRLLNEMYSVMQDLHGCRAVKFDSCNNLRSCVHTVIVNILLPISL